MCSLPPSKGRRNRDTIITNPDGLIDAHAFLNAKFSHPQGMIKFMMISGIGFKRPTPFSVVGRDPPIEPMQ